MDGIPGNIPIRKQPSLSTTEETQFNWSLVRPHMPPWMNFDSKTPILCHSFRLRIELSGIGHAERTPQVTAPTAYCALFRNVLLFCQATFVAEDETAARVPSDASNFGYVFLENLKPQALTQTSTREPRRTLSASVSFNLILQTRDSLTFILPTQSISLLEKWQQTLQDCLGVMSRGSTYDDSVFIQVGSLIVHSDHRYPSIWRRLRDHRVLCQLV